eukprot:Nk52_evm35s1763 gene=Nk52_evmTU35s1763
MVTSMRFHAPLNGRNLARFTRLVEAGYRENPRWLAAVRACPPLPQRSQHGPRFQVRKLKYEEDDLRRVYLQHFHKGSSGKGKTGGSGKELYCLMTPQQISVYNERTQNMARNISGAEQMGMSSPSSSAAMGMRLGGIGSLTVSRMNAFVDRQLALMRTEKMTREEAFDQVVKENEAAGIHVDGQREENESPSNRQHGDLMGGFVGASSPSGSSSSSQNAGDAAMSQSFKDLLNALKAKAEDVKNE